MLALWIVVVIGIVEGVEFLDYFCAFMGFACHFLF